MNRIVEKRVLADRVKEMIVEAPVIARKRKAGQFIILRVDDYGERIPLTIADSDPEAGTIRLIFQEVGKSTYALGELEEGDMIQDLAGPLGKPTHIENLGTVVCIGGGIGVAPVYPIAVAMKEAGNTVHGIIGARNKDLVIMEPEMKAVSDTFIVTTDDGSYGMKGFVTDALQTMIDDGIKIDMVVAIGPVIMMKFVAQLTAKYNIPTQVSLNAVMVDGTGMCGGCRVSVDGKSKFVCVDGPEFDGHLVNFDELMLRQSAYTQQEKDALDRHLCRLDKALDSQKG